jgi:hypothetical protein
MHGLVNRSIQCFLSDTWGAALWQRVASEAGVARDGFEALAPSDPALTEAVLAAAARQVALSRDALLEDLGTYLVSHPAREGIRRLLRFGGRNFDDFLMSLEDLPARGRLAMPDLDLPSLRVSDEGGGRYLLELRAGVAGVGHVAIGLLRAMADDYGALAILVHEGARPGGEAVSVQVAKADFASGRRFDLAALP